MAAKCIVNFRSWGKIDSKTWDYILEQLMNGKPVGIWSGHYPDIPKDWVIGKCSLRVKVGSRFQIEAGLKSLNHEELGRKYGRYEVKVTLNKEDRMYYICIL